MTLNQDFNNSSKIDDLDYQLSTEAVSDVNILDTLGDRPLVGSEVDYASLMIGDTGSEPHLATISDMASTSSGEFGKMSVLERDVDQAVLARTGDRSFNLSDPRQAAHEEHIYATPDQDMPVVGDNEEELEVAIQCVCAELSDAGVSESELNQAMAAGGVDDPRATVEALHDLAQDNNVPIEGYIQDIDQGYANLQVAEGVENVSPVVGTIVDEPELAVNEPEYEQSQPASSSMSFG